MLTTYQHAKARYCVALARTLRNWDAAPQSQRDLLLAAIWDAKVKMQDAARNDTSDGLGSQDNMLAHAAADALEGMLYGNIQWQDTRWAKMPDGTPLLDNMYAVPLADVYHSNGIE